MQLEEQFSQKPFIQAVNGSKIYEQDLSNILYVLANEHLFQDKTSYYQNFQNEQKNQFGDISLQNIQQIRQFPKQCLSNLVLNNVQELDFELKKLFLSDNNSQQRFLIIDSTSVNNKQDPSKLLEIQQINENKFIICKGYTYKIDFSSLYSDQSKNEILYSQQNIFQSIEFEFSLGTQGAKPAFIGEIILKDTPQTHQNIVENVFLSYYNFSKKNNVPIYYSFSEIQDQETEIQNIIQRAQTLNLNLSLIVLWDLSLDWDLASNSSIENEFIYNLKQFSFIEKLLEQGFNIGFKTLQFQKQMDLFATFILRLLKKNQNFENKIIFSSGVNYKIDLEKYGGSGYGHFKQLLTCLQQNGVQQQQIEKMFSKNTTKLMMWSIEKIIQKQIIYWQCPVCKQKFDEEKIDKFKKFGKEFCSIKCLKQNIN